MHLLEHSPQALDFLLIGGFLTLGKLEGLEHLFHVLEGLPEVVNHLADEVDGFADRRGSGRDVLARWFRGAGFLDARRPLILAATAEIATLRSCRRTALKPGRALRFGLTRNLGFGLRVWLKSGFVGLIRHFHVLLGLKIRFGDFDRRFLIESARVCVRSIGHKFG
jgi:hypothetical protein